MAQQTAVEWLVEMITDMIHESHHSEFADLYESAKQMEKDQIMHAYNNGENRSAELYYTQTYGK